MQQIPYFGKFEKTIRCERCTRKYPNNLDKCPHCADINDGLELEEFKLQNQMELRGASELGKYFMIASIATVVLLLLASL